VFGASDAIALGCIDVLRAHKLRVPADVSVVGFDDTVLAVSAQMATVRQPLQELGARGVEVLLERIESRGEIKASGKADNIILPATIVLRPTLAAPRRRALLID
jgi:DNA-binding LacI/PurR family transcriptional regulator